MKIESGAQVRFNSISIEVETPKHGKLYVHIMEDEAQNPCGIQLNLGKAGGELASLINGIARLSSLCLDKGASISELLAELSNNTADFSIRRSNGVEIHSILDALCYALLEYQRDRYTEHIRLLDTDPRLGG